MRETVASQPGSWTIRRSNVLERSTPGFVVLATASGEITTLTGSAPSVWAQLDGRRSVQQIAVELAGEHHAAPHHVIADVERLVAELLDARLVERVNTPGVADDPS